MLHNCYVVPESVQKLLKSTPKDALHSLITQYFTYKPTNKVNMMEVLAGLITYAECPWDVKVKLALDIFDLDQNHVITYDEMVFMSRSFMNGIGIMTEAALFHKAALDSLGDQAFVLADSTPDGQITFEE